MDNIFKGKRVLISGHTGFKGSWLSIWLIKKGAKVFGLSLKPHTSPSIYDAANLNNKIEDIFLDINNHSKVIKVINDFQPDFIFHLAAQAIVHESYLNPLTTFNTNLIGTLNILEGIRNLNKPCISILITSDKCYENIEWEYGYRETDKLGGADPYSASKAATEIMISSYIRSFFSGSNKRIGIARAGNVIGGGDWSQKRLVPDCITSWVKKKKVLIRSANSTRPWQHVLEPLSGYIEFAKSLYKSNMLDGQPLNFGPNSNNDTTVYELVDKLNHLWKSKIEIEHNKQTIQKEANLLKLNCDKALYYLGWKSKLSFLETVEMTSVWYHKFYYSKEAPYDLILEDIKKFEKKH